MSDCFAMDNVKITSPCWSQDIGLLAQNAVIGMDGNRRPIWARFGRLIGPEAILKVFLEQLIAGPVLLTLTSLQDNTRIFDNCRTKRGYRQTYSVRADDMQIVGEFLVDFMVVTDDSAEKRSPAHDRRHGR